MRLSRSRFLEDLVAYLPPASLVKRFHLIQEEGRCLSLGCQCHPFAATREYLFCISLRSVDDGCLLFLTVFARFLGAVSAGESDRWPINRERSVLHIGNVILALFLSYS
ncbi:hypothetical protein L596_013546 [Steinernema carpocapsae]|uniref:Uncharacterized protein n=1 Tax=Steinernema carpocapsae TaxID=34508 RepID=A0A4U5P0H7_STECR|nr:hypothetical protein L596_013546 [Steinernema carpocapsae]